MVHDNGDRPEDYDGSPTRTEPCSTSAKALVDHGVGEGDRLVRRTYYDLLEDGYGTFDASAAVLDRIATTFRAVYAEVAGVPAVPPAVDAAIVDARLKAGDELDASADLRETAIPRF